MSRKYIIIDTSELDSLDFSKLTTTSKELARKNLAGNKAIVAYEGDTPSELVGKVEYNISDLIAIVNVESTWYEES
tara:strand:+ start:14703 stop:14930 length:228 start_codon:yes stop_codon:yes gene_type:complete